jgi:mannose-6-phosphate isomerase-like protein (cupin superfamily)
MTAESSIRRVVTTHDASGKAVVGFDNIAPQTGGQPELGVKVFNLWTTDQTPADIAGSDDAATRRVGIPPPPNGSIFRVVEFQPTPKADKLDPNFLAKIAGHDGKPGSKPLRHPGMHRTHSIDYAIVLSGEIDMLLDDSEVHLEAGDVLVQRGAVHAWVNHGKEPCRIAFILIDAKGI